MKLRTYLMKRTMHMIITILIVLVLLFVLYRMMPGSAAASMMMNPKMTQTEIDMVKVRYGFGVWADYPGDYMATNLDPQVIGTYTVTVEATDRDGSSDNFTTEFDINPVNETDYISPRIMDIGIISASLGQKGEFYLMAYDLGAIKNTEVTLIFPNLTSTGDDTYPYAETFKLNAVESLTNETLHQYYYNGTSISNLGLGQDGSSNYSVQFKVEDRFKNIGTAVMGFDAVTGLESFKIWNLTVDIAYSNRRYSYPTYNTNVNLHSNVNGTAPTFYMETPDKQTYPITTLNNDLAGNFDGVFRLPDNGMMTFYADLGEANATFIFPVNAPLSTEPTQVQDNDGISPVLSDLFLNVVNERGAITAVSQYPYIMRDLRLRINATALDSEGERCPIVNAFITKPDGSVAEVQMTHPTYVKDRSMGEQFITYMKTMLVFDFGTSYIYQRPSWDVILERVPSTALLFGSAMIIAYALGIMIGVVVAWRRGTVFEMSTIIVTLFFYSMPIFWFALIMQWVFYAQLDWFPLAGMGGLDKNGLTWFLDVLWHLAMPLTTLVILGLAGDILLMRSCMLEVIGEDFTITAKAKGLKERTVIYKHVARNAMLPVVTSMAMGIGAIISGGVLTETIFSWFGMGTLLIEGTLSKDFPVVQGAFYVLALLTIFGNMAADILYAWLDPRVQL